MMSMINMSHLDIVLGFRICEGLVGSCLLQAVKILHTSASEWVTKKRELEAYSDLPSTFYSRRVAEKAKDRVNNLTGIVQVQTCANRCKDWRV